MLHAAPAISMSLRGGRRQDTPPPRARGDITHDMHGIIKHVYAGRRNWGGPRVQGRGTPPRTWDEITCTQSPTAALEQGCEENSLKSGRTPSRGSRSVPVRAVANARNAPPYVQNREVFKPPPKHRGPPQAHAGEERECGRVNCHRCPQPPRSGGKNKG